MGKKIIKSVILMIFIVCFCFTSCGLSKNISDVFYEKAEQYLSKSDEYIRNNLLFEHIISFSYENQNDLSVIEKRMSAIGFEIKEREQTDNGMQYTLTLCRDVEDEILNMLVETPEVLFLDENGNLAFEKSDVLSVEIDEIAWGTIIFVTGESLNAIVDKNNIDPITLSINGEKFTAFTRINKTDKGNEISLFSSGRNYKALAQMTMVYSSDEFEGKVSMEIVQSAKSIKKTESKSN